MSAAVQPLPPNKVQNGFTQISKVPPDTFVRYATESKTGLEGPDQVLPADADVTTEPDGRVRIKLDGNGLNSSIPLSIPGILTRQARTYPNHLALIRNEDNGRKMTYTYKEYDAEVRVIAKAFLKLGLERHHGVCILGFNSPEWLLSHLGAIYAGGLSTGIYTTNSPEACHHCMNHSQANIVLVEDEKQLDKVFKIKDRLPHLKAIIQYNGIPRRNGVLSWGEVLEMGEKESDDKLDNVLRTMGVNEGCVLIYTSGTVGNPKGVMLNHDNVLHDARVISHALSLSMCKDVLVSYLPLSHIAAQTVDIYACLVIAGTVYFADKNALKGTLVNTLQTARPTLFVGVPRVWEKIYEKMQSVGRNNGVIKTWIANWAKAQGLYYNMNRMNGVDYKHWGYIIAKWLVFNKVKAALGLDRCEAFISAAAPLSTDIQKYFMSLDMPILECYGMSECSGGHTLSANNRFRLGTVGPISQELHVKLDNMDSTGEGEVCMSGRNVFMGYLNAPDKTAEALDKDGWLHSGDLGRIDKDGFLYITGRIKELIITAGGENIPPVHIEHLVLAECDAISNAFLIGDKRKFLTMLITLKTETNQETGEVLDSFAPGTLAWAKSIGSKCKTVSEVLTTRDPPIYKEIDEAIKRANMQAISNAQKVQKFEILMHDFSILTGELGPTLKVRRNIVMKMYADVIESMYKDD